MGMAESEHIYLGLPRPVHRCAHAQLDMVEMSVGRKDADTACRHNALVGDYARVVAVAADMIERDIGKGGRQLLGVPRTVAEMEQPVGALVLHRPLHVCHISVRIGKNENFHKRTLFMVCHIMRVNIPSYTELEGYAMQNPKHKPVDMMSSPEASALLKDPSALTGLLGSPDTKKLMAMLNQSAGGDLKGAADAAMKGDASALMGLMQQVMGSKEGANLVDKIQKSVPKK